MGTPGDFQSNVQLACFTAGTPVRTPEGSTAIDQLRVGDYVLSRNEHSRGSENSQNNMRRVEQIFVLRALIVELTIGGKLIETTAEHPFFVENKGWKNAENLVVGDRVKAMDLSWVSVEQITKTDYTTVVHNFRVEHDHTYFIGGNDWGFAVWVHNSYNWAKEGAEYVVKFGDDIIETGFRTAAEAQKRVKELIELSKIINTNADKLKRIRSIPWGKFMSGGCADVAIKIKDAIGGTIHRVKPTSGDFLGPRWINGQWKDTPWEVHDIVVKNGRVYDALTGPKGLTIEEFKKLWKYADAILFSF